MEFSSMMAWWSALLPHNKKVPASNPQRRPFCVEFGCSPHACVDFLQVLQLPSKDMHVRLTGGSKLPVGVIVSVHELVT